MKLQKHKPPPPGLLQFSPQIAHFGPQGLPGLCLPPVHMKSPGCPVETDLSLFLWAIEVDGRWCHAGGL